MYRKDPVEFAWHYWLNHRNKDPYKVLANWQSSDWQPDEFQRFLFEHLYLANKNYIKNNKVIDLGCYIGVSSYTIMETGAAYVTGIDIQNEVTKFAPIILEKGGYTNCSFITADTDTMLELPKDHNVIISSFFVRQVMEHYHLFEIIKNSDCQTLILWDSIDNEKQLKHWHSKHPDVLLVEGNFTGTSQHVKKGMPNKKYILDTFKDWTVRRDDMFENAHIEEPYCWTITLTRN